MSGSINSVSRSQEMVAFFMHDDCVRTARVVDRVPSHDC